MNMNDIVMLFCYNEKPFTPCVSVNALFFPGIDIHGGLLFLDLRCSFDLT